MSKYWVNLGCWGSDEDDEEIEQVRKKLTELATIREGEFGQLTHITDDLTEAKETCKRAKDIITAANFSADEVVEVVSVVRQPECPNCGYLGRFSDRYCPRCRSELLQAEYVDS